MTYRVSNAPRIRSALYMLPILAGALLAMTTMASATAEEQVFTLTIKNHRFEPQVLEVPAGQKFKVLVKNQDATPEEFDSYDLDREKVVSGGSEGIVFLGPLDPGTYEFMGEFHSDTAKGKVVAK